SGFSYALDAEGIRVGRRFGPVPCYLWYHLRGREKVVCESRCYVLTIVVEEHFLYHRLTDSLHHAAVDLPLHDHWVDYLPTIIDREVLEQFHNSCLLVYLCDGDMGPEWERVVRR